jgi:hypothetical protein
MFFCLLLLPRKQHNKISLDEITLLQHNILSDLLSVVSFLPLRSMKSGNVITVYPFLTYHLTKSGLLQKNPIPFLSSN